MRAGRSTPIAIVLALAAAIAEITARRAASAVNG